MKAYDIQQAIHNRYSDSRRYAVVDEVQMTTGYSKRRLDVVALDCYQSNGFRIDGFEIKVSKADLKRELENPEKHVEFFDRLDYFSLACPKGLADVSLIPKKWGILQVDEDLSSKWLRRPIALKDEIRKTLPIEFVASLCRSIINHKVTDEEIEAAYNEGMEYQRTHDVYNRTWVEERKKDLEDYQALRNKLGLFFSEDIDSLDESLEQFKNFSYFKKDLKRFNGYISSVIRTLQELSDSMNKLALDDGKEA